MGGSKSAKKNMKLRTSLYFIRLSTTTKFIWR